MRPWMFLALLTLLSTVGLGAREAQAADPKAQAKQFFQSGEQKFQTGDYSGAILDFEAADKLVPSPILSYNIALCQERLGRDDLAIQHYKAYLSRRPDAANREQVETRIAEAEARLRAKTSPPPVVTPPPAEGPPPPGKSGGLPGALGGAGRKAGPSESLPPPPSSLGPPPPASSLGPPPPPSAGKPPTDPSLAKRLPGRAPAPGAPGGSAVGGELGGELPRGAGGPGLGGPAIAARGGDAEPAPVPAGPAPTDSKKKAKPLYKEWWFWAVMGVSAIIVVDVIRSDGGSNVQPRVPSGATILRF